LHSQGIFAARYNPNNTSELSKKTLLLSIGYPYSFNVNLLTGNMYWVGSGLMQGEIDLLNPVEVRSPNVLANDSSNFIESTLFIDKNRKFVTGTPNTKIFDVFPRGIYTTTVISTTETITPSSCRKSIWRQYTRKNFCRLCKSTVVCCGKWVYILYSTLLNTTYLMFIKKPAEGYPCINLSQQDQGTALFVLE
jgi:hypothetical protein